MLPAFGQQAQEDLRTDRQLVFPTFRQAKVLQTFGRFVTAKANVLYRDGALCFIDPADGKVRKVANASVLGAVFDDSIRYERVEGATMGTRGSRAGASTSCSVSLRSTWIVIANSPPARPTCLSFRSIRAEPCPMCSWT